jgi:hypothetical protein
MAGINPLALKSPMITIGQMSEEMPILQFSSARTRVALFPTEIRIGLWKIEGTPPIPIDSINKLVWLDRSTMEIDYQGGNLFIIRTRASSIMEFCRQIAILNPVVQIDETNRFRWLAKNKQITLAAVVIFLALYFALITVLVLTGFFAHRPH